MIHKVLIRFEFTILSARDDREPGGYGGGGGHDRGYSGGGGGYGGPPMAGGGWGGGDLRQHIPPAVHPGNFGGGPPMNR